MSDPSGAAQGHHWPPGWYPDPLRRFTYRYFNGQRWTADVADGGSRFVDNVSTRAAATSFAQSPVHPTTASAIYGAGGPQRPRTGRATAAMVLAIVGVAIGWVPILFAVGIVCTVLAVVFGVLGLRAAKRQDGAGRSFAVAGLALAPVAAAACVGGVALTVVVFDRIDAYLEEGPRRAEITSCGATDGLATVRGTVENLSDRQRDYVVRVVILRARTDNVMGAIDVAVDDVAVGAISTWEAEVPVVAADVSCTIDDVTGPFPFGVDPG